MRFTLYKHYLIVFKGNYKIYLLGVCPNTKTLFSKAQKTCEIPACRSVTSLSQCLSSAPLLRLSAGLNEGSHIHLLHDSHFLIWTSLPEYTESVVLITPRSQVRSLYWPGSVVVKGEVLVPPADGKKVDVNFPVSNPWNDQQCHIISHVYPVKASRPKSCSFLLVVRRLLL